MAEPPDIWASARAVTPARIGLARAGASIATTPWLAFRLAHARARDAVHAQLDVARLAADLAAIGWADEVLAVESAVADRQEYLLRPDLGRRLSAGAETRLGVTGPCDLAIVVADGLSARAAQAYAASVLAAMRPALTDWSVAAPVIVLNGRVAIGDSVAGRRQARAVLVLIGERPGLSAPDSLGAYITWMPHTATTDAERNCVSNIRPGGNAPGEAAARIVFLLGAMRRRGVSGVALKDESEAAPMLA
jgi:ethanolamine ammonia-lyase small subunit